MYSDMYIYFFVVSDLQTDTWLKQIGLLLLGSHQVPFSWVSCDVDVLICHWCGWVDVYGDAVVQVEEVEEGAEALAPGGDATEDVELATSIQMSMDEQNGNSQPFRSRNSGLTYSSSRHAGSAL